MSSSRLKSSTSCRLRAPVGRREEPPARRGTRGTSQVLAERSPAVVAVGAWVEGGQDFTEHPSALALLTEEIQAERRREAEESLQRFQDDVRHRVAQRAGVNKKRRQPQTDSLVKSDRRIQHHHQVSVDGRTQHSSSQESCGAMRQVRLRLAACRMIPREEVTSHLPGGEWNVSISRHKAESHVLREEEEEEEEEGDDHLSTSQHDHPVIQQKVSGSDPGSKSTIRVPPVLWPLADQEDLKRQRQAQFLMQRRIYMNIEREQVKENKQNRKHLKRTARMKAEKEQIRVEEERRMERVQQLEERELLIVERLKLEEEEREEELQRRKREEKVSARRSAFRAPLGRKGFSWTTESLERFVEALRAQMKERLSQEKMEPPPLCCCASSFWDSHPDTCANNCVFHNNPKAYVKALHSTLMSLDLQQS